MNASSRPLDDLRRLGLAPGASADALKTAWRRAVSQLHPDRHGRDADRELAEVNAAFQRLQAFHRQHGRLPGMADAPPTRTSASTSRRNRWGLALAGLSLTALVLWPQTDPSRAQGPDRARAEARLSQPAPTTTASPLGQRAEHLELGLAVDDVERLAGPPMFRSKERWEYGPSEVRFVDGKVSGWYSSPLRPLPVTAATASASPTID